MSARDLASLTHTHYEKPLRWWHYTDRFATAGLRDRAGRKHICGAAKIGDHWMWHTPFPPLPIYGAAALAARPDAPVLVFESESLADAAGGLFLDHVCVAWALGTSHVNAADIVPFENRDVVLWPGSDGASITAMERLHVRLNNYARSLATLAAPRTWPVSWFDPPPSPPDAVIKELRRALRTVSPISLPHVVGSGGSGASTGVAEGRRGSPGDADNKDHACGKKAFPDEDTPHEDASTFLPHVVEAAADLASRAAESLVEAGSDGVIADHIDDEDHVSSPLPTSPLRGEEELAFVDTDDWVTSDPSLAEKRRGDLPAFPLGTLPQFWRTWAPQAAGSARAPIDHVALSLLGAAAGLIGGSRRIAPTPAWSEPCVLWTALVGAASPGNSGMKAVLRLVRALDGDLGAVNAAACRRHRTALETARAESWWWREGVRGAVANHRAPSEIPAAAEEPPPFAPRQLVVNDPDSLVEALQGGARGTLLALDALGTWLAGTTRAAAQPCWSRWWSADPWMVKRRGQLAAGMPRGIAIPCAAVSIVAALHPTAIAAALAGGGADMAARILFAWPRHAAFHPMADLAAPDDGAARAALARLRDLPDAPRELPLASEALTAFDAFARRIDANADGSEGWVADWHREGAGVVLRLAGVLTFLAWAARPADRAEPTHVPVAAMQAAIGVWQDYLWPHAQAVLSAAGGSEPASHVHQVLQWLTAERPSEISREQIRRQALRQAVNAAGTDGIIAALVERGSLQPIQPETSRPGPRRRRWRVDSALWEGPR